MESSRAISTYSKQSSWNLRRLELKEIPKQRTSSHTNEMARYASLGSGFLRLEELAGGHATCSSCALQNDGIGCRAGSQAPKSARSQ
jgi:hypothetical protein